MCSKPKKQAAPVAKDPAWKTASANNTANRGAEQAAMDPVKRIAATDAGGTLGSSNVAGGPVTASVLGG